MRHLLAVRTPVQRKGILYTAKVHAVAARAHGAAAWAHGAAAWAHGAAAWGQRCCSLAHMGLQGQGNLQVAECSRAVATTLRHARLGT